MIEIIEKNIIKWAKEKGLLAPENTKNQFIKLVEEVGETGKAILKNDNENLKLEIGDCLVVLSILANQNRLDLYECFDAAWNKIKNRTGKTENGVFVKD